MTTFIDELIGWKRMSIAGVLLKFRNCLDITGATAVDDKDADTTHLTLGANAGSNVVCSGQFTLNGSGYRIFTPTVYAPGDVVVAQYYSGDDSSPQSVVIRQQSTSSCNATGDEADFCVYTYKVLR